MTKEEMKDAGIKSPDRADTLAMAYATQAPLSVTQPASSMGAVAPAVIVARSKFNDGYVRPF